MTKENIIEKTVKAIYHLPVEKAFEISDFATFLSERYEEIQLVNGIKILAEQGRSFNFLNEEPNIYQLSDLKENFND